jgi:hypothetical protein
MPILHVDPSTWRPSEYYSVDEYVRYLAYILEGAVGQMGPGVQRLFIIYWLPGLTMEMMKPRAMDCAKQLMKIMQDSFPERLGVAVICNAHPLFTAMWAACAGWIDPVTQAKFLTAPRGRATETLFQYIDEDVLPISLGGKHEEYPIPSRPIKQEIAEFLKTNTAPPATHLTAVRGVTEQTIVCGAVSSTHSGLVNVARGSIYYLKVHVEDTTKKVVWTFNEAKQREINFGYEVTDAEPVKQEPAPVDFTSGAQNGSVDVPKSWSGGTLTLIFDNSAARFFSANISYDLTIEAEDAK